MSKKAFYILNITWGLPMTLIGALVALALIISGHKPKRHGGCIYFNVGKAWGGLELGLFFLTDEKDREHTKNHELGHGVQNAIYGFFMPFLVCIPSAVRYWYRELRYRKKGITPPTAYDDIWFEGEATALGEKYIKDWEDTP